MFGIRVPLIALLLLALPALACFAERTCYSPSEAATHDGKDICLQAHVYSVEEEADGTRYLDVCEPGAKDSSCRMTVVSMAADREEIGSLNNLAQTDIRLRGVVHVVHGEAFLMLSSRRQLHDGPEKFRPNPSLLAGFSGGAGGTAFRDPALGTRRQKGVSSFKGTATAER